RTPVPSRIEKLEFGHPHGLEQPASHVIGFGQSLRRRVGGRAYAAFLRLERPNAESARTFFDVDDGVRGNIRQLLARAARPVYPDARYHSVSAKPEIKPPRVLRKETGAGPDFFHPRAGVRIERDSRAHRVPIAPPPYQLEGHRMV